jgi:hypothetical protein
MKQDKFTSLTNQIKGVNVHLTFSQQSIKKIKKSNLETEPKKLNLKFTVFSKTSF